MTEQVTTLQVSDYISNSSYALDENANAVESINLVGSRMHLCSHSIQHPALHQNLARTTMMLVHPWN